MKTIKVIDLLNKIANGEININNKYQFSRGDYCTISEFFDRYVVNEETLNLEIIEDIPKIEYKNRIKKAIEYIESNEKEYGSLEENEKIILDILRGEDNEKINL